MDEREDTTHAVLENRPDWVEVRVHGLVIRAIEDQTWKPSAVALGVWLPAGLGGVGVVLGLGSIATTGLAVAGLALGLGLAVRFFVVRTTAHIDHQRILVTRSFAGRRDEGELVALADVVEVFEIPATAAGRWRVRLQLVDDEEEEDRYVDLPMPQATRPEAHWLSGWLRAQLEHAIEPPAPSPEQIAARQQVESLLER